MNETPRGRLRRADRAMTGAEAVAFLASATVAHVGTVDGQGWPYVVPLLFVADANEMWFHNVGMQGHLRTNVEANARVCVEVDEANDVFPYGPTMCDTTVAYESVIVFGTAEIVDDPAAKAAFFDRFMVKYAWHIVGRPEHEYPRLDATTVYRVRIERMTGKRRDR